MSLEEVMPLMNRVGAMAAAGPLGRNPTVARVFDKCQCGSQTRMGRCENPTQHAQWAAEQSSQTPQQQFTCSEVPAEDTCTYGECKKPSSRHFNLLPGDPERITRADRCSEHQMT